MLEVTVVALKDESILEYTVRMKPGKTKTLFLSFASFRIFQI